MSAASGCGRCKAAHVADPRGCEGRPDAVRIVDQTGTGVEACLLHGAVLLASLDCGRVYPLHGPTGSAIVVYKRARHLPPLDFLTGPGVGHVTTTDEAAVFPYTPEPTLPPVDRASRRFNRDGDGNAWSGPGNARSSRWTGSCVSRLRGNA